jgi:3-methyl-2-oxobutanoate hydroxymethyltransferase
MGHLGLTPQSATMLGGYRAQGRTAKRAQQLVDDALGLEAAGCFALVLECVPSAVAERITQALSIPTIGIGAGAGCDGQVLVFHDVVGLTRDLRPKFVRRYADLSSVIEGAARAFTADVKSGAFPSKDESFTGVKPTTLRRVH